MKSLILKPLILSGLFFAIGAIWAVSSPIGSSADDDFHLTSIFCKKDNSFCPRSDSSKSISKRVIVIKKIAQLPPCFVGFPTPNSGLDRNFAKDNGRCVNKEDSEFVNSNRYNQFGQYPTFFHTAMSKLIFSNLEYSVFSMRIFNVFIFSLIIFIIISISPKNIIQSFLFSITIAFFPIGIFFVASTNPSSWVITGLITNWVFLANIFYYLSKKTYERVSNLSNLHNLKLKISILGYLVTFSLPILARYDSIFYLMVANIAVIILSINLKIFFNTRKKLTYSILSIFILMMTVLLLQPGRTRIFGKNLNFIPANPTTNQPNSIINTLIELPNFVLSVIGGQRPYWIQNPGELPWEYAYGVGWLEFSLPSLVSICLTISGSIILANKFQEYRKKNVIVFIFLLFCFVCYIIGWRLVHDYAAWYYFQPRYVAGFVISIFGIILLNSVATKISSFTAFVIMVLNTTANSTAWLSIYSRYSLGTEHPFSNLFYKPENLWKPFDWFERSYIFALIFILLSTLNYLVYKPQKRTLS